MYKIKAGDISWYVPKSTIKVFCYLARFSGEVMSSESIIKNGLSSRFKPIDIQKGSIKRHVSIWNNALPENFSKIEIGNKKTEGYFVGKIPKVTLLLTNGISIQKQHNTFYISEDGEPNNVSTLELTGDESKTFQLLVLNHGKIVKRDLISGTSNIAKWGTISRINKKLKLQSIANIFAISGNDIGNTLSINENLRK